MKRYIPPFILFFAACAFSTAQEPLKPVKLATLWTPQAQFAGYYMAQARGFYKKRGLDVSIVDATPEMPASYYLRSGKADYAVLWLEQALVLRGKGVNIKNFAQIVHDSGVFIGVSKKSGIKKPEDLDGRKVGVWPDFGAQQKAFFRRHGIHPKIVMQTVSPDIFLRGGVDALSAMIYDEYHVLYSNGVNPDEMTYFDIAEPGLNFPEDGLYALAPEVDADTQTACAFAQASFEGWRYAFAHPQETVELVVKRRRAAQLPATPMHQKWMLAHMEQLVFPRGKAPGILNEDDFASGAQELHAEGSLRRIPDYEDIFSACSEYE
jgi:NitT/TauT family transport system substrate-binding protein